MAKHRHEFGMKIARNEFSPGTGPQSALSTQTTAMQHEGLEYYRELDWDEIAAKVANFARKMARVKYGWSDDRLVAEGKSSTDLAGEAIAEFWNDVSKRPETCSVTTFLCGIVRRKLWNLSQSKDFTARINVESSPPEEFAIGASPDAMAAMRDDVSRALTLLSNHPTIKGKPHHELVLAAMGCGAFGHAEIARETQLPLPRIYQVQRELSNIYPDIRQHLNQRR